MDRFDVDQPWSGPSTRTENLFHVGREARAQTVISGAVQYEFALVAPTIDARFEMPAFMHFTFGSKQTVIRPQIEFKNRHGKALPQGKRNTSLSGRAR